MLFNLSLYTYQDHSNMCSLCTQVATMYLDAIYPDTPALLFRESVSPPPLHTHTYTHTYIFFFIIFANGSIIQETFVCTYIYTHIHTHKPNTHHEHIPFHYLCKWKYHPRDFCLYIYTHTYTHINQKLITSMFFFIIFTNKVSFTRLLFVQVRCILLC
jgi:hypothetical protein